MKNTFQKKSSIVDEQNPFILESGYRFDHGEMVYESYGTLNSDRSNVMLILHGLSGNTHGASHDLKDAAGWWEPLIGEGKPFDTSRFFILIPNILGSCFGTLGPTTINPRTDKPYGGDFPQITIRDIVAYHHRFLEEFGISAPKWVIGGSLGGMQALEWAVSYPEDKAHIISMVAPEKTSAQSIGFNYLMRRALWNDPKWNGGDYDPEDPPLEGLATARGIGIMTYQTRASMDRKFGRDLQNERWEIENYLDHQGQKIADFDAHSYLRLIHSMDTHDLTRDRDDYESRVRMNQGRILLIGDQSDLLYDISFQKNLAEKWTQWGAHARWHDLKTENGHDSFLVNFDELSAVLKEFIDI